MDNAASFIVKSTEYFVPLTDHLNVEQELAKLRSELEYQQGFLNSVMAKLDNERFVQGAPAKVVENERAKKADAQAKIKAIQERIDQLG
ncbi:MAG: hypothetical protein LUD68_09665 [Rikenellaceae bacterium]|nr:hypothetical protein [Rikenellaceae bacterium]